MASLNYTVLQGERWDIIALKMYGNISGIKTLIEANPQVPIDPILPDGSKLVIPIIEPTSTDIATSKLQPWKR